MSSKWKDNLTCVGAGETYEVIALLHGHPDVLVLSLVEALTFVPSHLRGRFPPGLYRVPAEIVSGTHANTFVPGEVVEFLRSENGWFIRKSELPRSAAPQPATTIAS